MDAASVERNEREVATEVGESTGCREELRSFEENKEADEDEDEVKKEAKEVLDPTEEVTSNEDEMF